MSDESTAPKRAPTEPHVIKQELIDHWISIPSDRPLGVPITRRDIDNLYFSIQKLVVALAFLRTADPHASPTLGDDDVKRLLDQSYEYAQQSMNHAAFFIEGLMIATAETHK